MRFPDSVLEEIKARIDLAGFISRYVDLRRAGSNLKGLCPFHQEKTASFVVTPSKGIYKCFGCGAAGGLFTFLRDIDNISFVEAVKILAKEAGVALPDHSDGREMEREKESDLLFRINDAARAFFMKALAAPAGKSARDYLDQRGVSMETAEAFSIGFAPDSYDALMSAMGKDFTQEDLVRAGLLVRREDNRTYDKFRNRLVFTIQNLSGLTCGFSARVLNKEDNPKYLNSPETPVFQKSRLLYGLLQAREGIKKEDMAVIVEGNVDLITLFQGGIKHAVASLGTAFTDSHALLLKRFCSRVTILYDGDKAGQNSAKRGLELLVNAGLGVRIVTLPEGDDPDTFFRKNGLERLLEELGKGKDLVDFLVDHFEKGKNLSEPENKSLIVKEMGPLLAAITDPVIRAEYVRKAALRIGTREDFLIRPSTGLRRPPQSREPAAPAPEPVSKEEAFQERVLTVLLRNSAATLPLVRRFMAADDFTVPVFRKLYLAVLENGVFNDTVLTLLTPDEQICAARLAVTTTEKSDGAAVEEMQGEILRYRRRQLEAQRSDLKQCMGLEQDEAAKKELMRKFQDLTARINGLSLEQE